VPGQELLAVLGSYRALLARSGARSLALVCGLGWLSYTGYGLALVLAVHRATHSFASAGGAVAAFSIGSGVLAPVRGRLIDRRGGGALRGLAAGHLLGAGMLLDACRTSHQSWLILGGAAIAGASAPPIMATARRVWAELAGDELARVGHALNAALADLGQIASPAFVGAVAVLASAELALAVLVAGAVGAAWVLGGRAGRGWASGRAPVGGVLRASAGLRTLVLGDLALGAWTAGIEVALTAVGARHGAAALAAVPLAVSAAGSIVVSVWSGGAAAIWPPAARYRGGALLVACALPLLLLTSSLATIAAVLAVVGAGFGMLNVAVFELLDRVVDSDRATEAFTWLTTSYAAGAAGGAAACGRLAQSSITGALALVAGFGAAGAVVALLGARTLRAKS
jgi:hypothetical protein